MKIVWAVGIALGLGVGAGARAESALDNLTSFSEQQPLRVEDAKPQAQGANVSLPVVNGDDEGRPGVVFQPSAQLNLVPNRLELGAGMQAGRVEREVQTGPVTGHLLWGITKEEPRVPALGLKAELQSPTSEQGLSTRMLALGTKTVGLTRWNANAGYLARNDALDRFDLGLSVDRAITGRLLAVGEGTFQRTPASNQNGYSAAAGLVGALTKSTSLYGVAGAMDNDGVWRPRLTFGVSASMQ